jgi:hypothetical protein
MSLKQTIYLAFDVEFFNIEEIDKAEQSAIEINGELYCWKTIGSSNWLEKGLSISDVLGIVILPRSLPEQIDMLDDEETDE